MSTQENPLPPVPSTTPITEGKFGLLSTPWMKWLVDLRLKVNTIGAALVQIATNNVAGFLASDGSGGINARTLTAGTNITITNPTGALGNPVISSAGGGGSPITITVVNATSYTVTSADVPSASGSVGWIDQDSTSTNVINIDTYTNQPLPIGAHIYIRQAQSGTTTINALSGVGFSGPSITGGGIGSVGEAVQITQNNWAIFGTLAWTSIIPYYNEVMADSPIAYYRLGETSGTTAADSSGNGYNGIYEGTVTLGAPSLILNNLGNLALGGDGTSVYVRIGGPSTLYGLNRNFSIEGWVKPNFTASGQISGLWSSGLAGVCIRIGWNGTNISVELLSDYSASLYTWTTTVGNNTTTHIVFTCTSSGVCTLYINGSAFGSTYTATNTFTGTGVIIGGDGNYPSTPGTYLFGELDEVAAYNTALSAARVLAHYNAGA